MNKIPIEIKVLDKARKHFDVFQEAIEYCLKNKLINPALVLIYSCIDTLAYLDREESEEEVTKRCYIRWVNKFLLPNSNLNCRAEDLYGARCALIHTSTAESSMSKKGKARMIYYASGNAKIDPLKKFIEKQLPNKKIRIVHANTLYMALLDSIARYLRYLAKDKVKIVLFTKRSEKILGYMDAVMVTKALEFL